MQSTASLNQVTCWPSLSRVWPLCETKSSSLFDNNVFMAIIGLKVFFVYIPWGVFDSADATSFAFFNIAEYNFKFRFEIIFILSCVRDIILFFLSPSVTQ